jgi:hypothetical protein
MKGRPDTGWRTKLWKNLCVIWTVSAVIDVLATFVGKYDGSLITRTNTCVACACLFYIMTKLDALTSRGDPPAREKEPASNTNREMVTWQLEEENDNVVSTTRWGEPIRYRVSQTIVGSLHWTCANSHHHRRPPGLCYFCDLLRAEGKV